MLPSCVCASALPRQVNRLTTRPCSRRLLQRWRKRSAQVASPRSSRPASRRYLPPSSTLGARLGLQVARIQRLAPRIHCLWSGCATLRSRRAGPTCARFPVSDVRPRPACCCSLMGCPTSRLTRMSHVSARDLGCSGPVLPLRSCTTRCSRSRLRGRSSSSMSTCCATDGAHAMRAPRLATNALWRGCVPAVNIRPTLIGHPAPS